MHTYAFATDKIDTDKSDKTQSPIEKSTGDFSSTGRFQKAILMAMVQRSKLMQQETLCARVKGLREGGSTMDTQMCSSLKPVEVLLWKIFLKKTKVETFFVPINKQDWC